MLGRVFGRKVGRENRRLKVAGIVELFGTCRRIPGRRGSYSFAGIITTIVQLHVQIPKK